MLRPVLFLVRGLKTEVTTFYVASCALGDMGYLRLAS